MAEPQIRYDTTPAPAQIAAGLRQAALIIGSALGALGLFPGVADFLQRATSPEAVGVLSVIATVVALVWGQIATRKTAKKLAVTGEAAPNTVAQPK